MNWYLLTGEYPPAPGGVADYTRNVAEALACRGDRVTVIAPKTTAESAPRGKHPGVRIVWLPGHFGWRGQRGLRKYLEAQPPGGRLLVQYVAQAFGWKAMNVPLCAWLARQRRHQLWVMFHEVAFPRDARQPWRHTFLAHVTRWMARRLANSAERVLISTAAWSNLLGEICGRSVPAEWSPVPSNFEGCVPPLPKKPGKVSGGGAFGGRLLGHFGTFGKLIAEPLAAIIPAILERCPEAEMLLIGRGSIECCQSLENSGLVPRGRVTGTGDLPPMEVAEQVQSCELLIQPFPDGVSTRRTSAMCGLALGRPMITQVGPLTESIWKDSRAVRLVPGAVPAVWASAVRQVLDSDQERRQLGERATVLYQQNFSLARTIDLLRKWDERSGSLACTSASSDWPEGAG